MKNVLNHIIQEKIYNGSGVIKGNERVIDSNVYVTVKLYYRQVYVKIDLLCIG
jgi:hypothetical protein